MNAQSHTINLRLEANQHAAHANKLRQIASMLDSISRPPGQYVVELARMLRQHGLCVVERNALAIALMAMEVSDDEELEGDEHVGAFEYGKAMDAVREAMHCSYPMPASPELQPPAVTIEDEAKALIDRAIAEGKIVTITNEPSWPPVMGDATMRADVRRARRNGSYD